MSPPGEVATSHFYVCRSAADGGCRGVSIAGPPTDAVVAEYVRQRLGDVEIEEDAADRPWPRAEELCALELRLADLMAAYTDGRLTAGTVFPQAHELVNGK